MQRTVAEPVARRVAVLVDGENISHELAGRIAGYAATLGRVAVQRVYGNVGQLPGWDAVLGFRLIHAGTGKNATDLLLAVDAMDFALSGRAETFVLASSDRDFTHLATRLRERGFAVIGMGSNPPEALRIVCTNFEVLTHPRREGPAKTTEADAAGLNALERSVVAMLRAAGGNMPIDALSMRVWKEEGTKISGTKEKSWRPWLLARPLLFACDARGPGARVHLKSQASPRSAP